MCNLAITYHIKTIIQYNDLHVFTIGLYRTDEMIKKNVYNAFDKT